MRIIPFLYRTKGLTTIKFKQLQLTKAYKIPINILIDVFLGTLAEFCLHLSHSKPLNLCLERESKYTHRWEMGSAFSQSLQSQVPKA